MIKKFGLLLIVLCLSACAWLKGENRVEPAPLQKFEPETKISKVWSRSIGNQGHKSALLALTPAISGGMIYTANHKGELLGLDVENGKKRWKADINQPVISAVGVGEGVVAVATTQGYLVVVNQNDSAIRWQAALSSEMLSAAQIANGRVIAQTIDGRVVCLDLETGRQLWDFSAIMPVLSLRGSATPAIQDNAVYLAFASGKIVALDLETGVRIWQQQIAIPSGKSELDRIIDIDMKPLIVGDDVYVASFQGQAASLNRLNGRGAWKVQSSNIGDMGYGPGKVYLTDQSGAVFGLSMLDGRKLWQNAHFSDRQPTAPATLGDLVAVADFEGFVHFMDGSDGHFVARYKVGGKGVRNPVLSDGKRLYVLNNKGKLFALANRK